MRARAGQPQRRGAPEALQARISRIGDLDGDGQDEILVSSPWGIGVLKEEGGTMTAVTMVPNGTRLGGWLLNTADNTFGPVADYDGDGRDGSWSPAPGASASSSWPKAR